MGAGQEQLGPEGPEEVYPLRPSLFPHVPPYLRFLPAQGGPRVFKVPPPEELREMQWQVPCTVWLTIMDCIEFNGFTVSEVKLRQFESCIGSGAIWDSLPVTEKKANSIEFEKLHEAVKINQWPAMHQLGRKDNLFTNYALMQREFGAEDWSYMPHTYILPAERDQLRRVMRKSKGSFWIVKPPNLFCGMGIKVINDFKDVPMRKGQLCVQRYLKKPLLINNLKFDLRVYVLVTSVEPLRIYLYEEGLARFATEPYTNDPGQIGNNFVHLTNFSINKESDKFVHNVNPEEAEGSKWTLSSLWKHLKLMGIEKGPIWAEIREIVIKSILSAQTSLKKAFHEQVNSYYNCYKLLGYDIFIDDKLKAHLIEVNTLPSLAASPNTIDSHVKGPLVAEMFNIAGFHLPSNLAGRHSAAILSKLDWAHPRLQPLAHDRRLYCKGRDDEDLGKQAEYEGSSRDEYLQSLLELLTPQDIRLLVHAEDELAQTMLFSRIWPTDQTHQYFPYLESVPYAEKLMDTYEYYYSLHRAEGVEYISEYCQDKLHLKIPKQVAARVESGEGRPGRVVIPAFFQGGE